MREPIECLCAGRDDTGDDEIAEGLRRQFESLLLQACVKTGGEGDVDQFHKDDEEPAVRVAVHHGRQVDN